MLRYRLNIRHYFFNSSILYAIRITIALIGVTLGPWLLHEVRLTVPLTLGVVAAALTDLDDRLTGRLRNLLITLLCFLLASVSIQLLMPYPWLFVIGLLVSTFAFILLGTLGQRYATIAFGALLIAIYTMLGSDTYQHWYIQPFLLLTGALWYNLLTLLGHLILPILPVQDKVAQSFNHLANYLEAKANLFDSDEENNFQSQLIDLAMANKLLVNTLNQTKASLLSRLKNDRGQRGTRRLLHYYFVVQDIHERTSSAHVNYQSISQLLRYSDVLFRFQRLLSLQAKACRQIGESIKNNYLYQHSSHFERTFIHLHNALKKLALTTDINAQQLDSLWSLLRNLGEIDTQLANIQKTPTNMQSEPLSYDNLRHTKTIPTKLIQQFTPKSALFRHAVRMAIVLSIGYLIAQCIAMYSPGYQGYWIMLTALFVCQPNYNATRHRLKLRVIGTIIGILIGAPILFFIPSQEGQLVLIIISGLLFFSLRNVQYAHATMFITLLALLCFNLNGNGFDVILPRLIDTLIGCAIAWFAVSYIWPDWKFRKLSTIIEQVFHANGSYLDAILIQYYQGKSNSLDYRIARREAHNHDAELATIVSGLSVEPKKDHYLVELGFRLLCLNQTLLGYISALGAHREKLINSEILALLDDAVCYVTDTLQSEKISTEYVQEIKINIDKKITQLTGAINKKHRLIVQQIILIISILPELIELKKQIKLYSPIQANLKSLS